MSWSIAAGGACLLAVFLIVGDLYRRDHPDVAPSNRGELAILAGGIVFAVGVVVGAWLGSDTTRIDTGTGGMPKPAHTNITAASGQTTWPAPKCEPPEVVALNVDGSRLLCARPDQLDPER